MEMKETFQTVIYSRRKALHLTQEQVAEQCGVTPRHYQNIETGHCRPGLDIALRISAVLDVDLNALRGNG